MPSEIPVDSPKYILLQTDADWKNVVDKCMNESKKMIIDFYADWCGPCKSIAPLFGKLSNQYPETIFLKIDSDNKKLSELTKALQVTGLPTFIVIEHNKETDKLTVIDKLVGGDPAKLQEMVHKHAHVKQKTESETQC